MLDSIQNWLNSFRPIPNTGLLLDDPAKLASLPKHELFVWGGSAPADWSSFCPPFRYQGSTNLCTAYAGSSIASIFESKENIKSVTFSPSELFFRSNGQLNGNYLINTANAMKAGVVPEVYVPTVIPDRWDVNTFNAMKDKSHASPQAEALSKQYAIKSAASVIPDRNSVISALGVSPLMLALGIGKGYFNTVAPRQTAYSAYHAVVLAGIDKDGNYVIFDSLTQHKDFDGFHKLAPDYEVLSALSFIDLPDNWQEIQDKDHTDTFSGVLNHYGFSRDLHLEQTTAQKLTDVAKLNANVQSYIGRDFLVYVNAVAYGRYSIQDILNYCYSIRRGLKLPFNLNLPRNMQV
jgi:hypothetical protein